MIFELKPKVIGTTKVQVCAAWKRIRLGCRGTGVDDETIEVSEHSQRKCHYPNWK